MTLACDYAWSKPNAQAIKAAGYDVALRYLSPDPSKNLSKPEANALLAAGVGIGLVWESTSNRAVDGAGAGAQDGQTAAGQASALGYPAGCPLLANLGDFAAAPSQIGAIDAYYQAFCANTRVWAHGGYATGYIIDQLVGRGRTGIWWENAMNDAGEFGSHVSANAWIYQRTAHTVAIAATPGTWWDENLIVRPAAWWGATAPVPTPAPIPPAPIPAPTPVSEDDPMLIFTCPSKADVLVAGGVTVNLDQTSLEAVLKAAPATLIIPLSPTSYASISPAP